MINLSNAQISILIMAYDQLNLSIVKRLSTVKYNMKKLRETKSLKYRGGNGRPCVISSADSTAIVQYILRDNETTLKEIKEKLSKAHQRSVSLSTISRHLCDHDYRLFYLSTHPY